MFNRLNVYQTLVGVFCGCAISLYGYSKLHDKYQSLYMQDKSIELERVLQPIKKFIPEGSKLGYDGLNGLGDYQYYFLTTNVLAPDCIVADCTMNRSCNLDTVLILENDINRFNAIADKYKLIYDYQLASFFVGLGVKKK